MVNDAYQNQTPAVVKYAMDEFDSDAKLDLDLDTQDFQTRYAPEAVCATAEATVDQLYGIGACTRGSVFFTTSTRYERGLISWNQRGDPATGAPIAINVAALKVAFSRMRSAETALVRCVVKNNSHVTLTVKGVDPGPGFVVANAASPIILPPGAERGIDIEPGPDVAPALGTLPTFAFDFDPADQELNKPYPTWAVVLAAVLALLSAGAAAFAAWGKGREGAQA